MHFLHPRFLEMKTIERLPDEGYRRVVLPISSQVPCSRDSPSLMTSCNQVERFFPERLLIQEGADWCLLGMGVDGMPWIREVVQGLAFAPAERGSLPRRVLRAGDRVSLGVTYHGAASEASFMGCLFGSTREVLPSPVEASLDGRVLVATSDRPARSAEVARVRIPVPTDCWPRQLALWCPGDWVVTDVLIDDQSILLPDGNMFSGTQLPGELFSGSRSVFRIGRLAAGSSLIVEATYGGSQEEAHLKCGLWTRPSEDDLNGGLSTFVSLSSGVDILPGTSAQITARPLLPRGYVFRPQRLVLREPHKWMVDDVTVGNMSQFARAGVVPGEAFSWGAVGNDLVMDVLSKGAEEELRLRLMNVEVGGGSGSRVVAGVAGTLFRVSS